MIGKIKKLNFAFLFILISIGLIVCSYYFNNYSFINVYLVFFVIGLLVTKYGLNVIKRLNILQNIRNNGPSNHFKKINTPTMGGIFIFGPFLLFLIM